MEKPLATTVTACTMCGTLPPGPIPPITVNLAYGPIPLDHAMGNRGNYGQTHRLIKLVYCQSCGIPTYIRAFDSTLYCGYCDAVRPVLHDLSVGERPSTEDALDASDEDSWMSPP